MFTAKFVLPFSSIRATDLPLVGGKGANLGELTHAGFPVPPGFCVTTSAFEQFRNRVPNLNDLYTRLETLRGDDIVAARQLGLEWRTALCALPVTDDIATAILEAWTTLGSDQAYAVRSSATAEDLPDASFAGQQDSYLNVRGEAQLLEAVRKCWASLFTERAILYRQQHRVSHREVSLSVVVQRMVESEVSGILFTADPISGQRSVTTIDASFGLGEAFVSGLVNADAFRVDRRAGRILERHNADKRVAVQPALDGGVTQVELEETERTRWALSDAQVLELSALGARIEAHYTASQDIEWAWANGQWFVLQARPITTLFPLPTPRPNDETLHAYLSFSHFQVMTDAMPPLAASVWRVLFPFGRQPGVLENPLLTTAGGRLYLDASYVLRHPILRRVVPRMLRENADPLIGTALENLATRAEFQHGPHVNAWKGLRGFGPILLRALGHLLRPQSEGAASRALERINTEARRVSTRLRAAPNETARLEVTTDELSRLLPTAATWLVPEVVAGLISDSLSRRLSANGASAADIAALTRGLSGNVTTEMDLALGDLADAARDSPELAARLQRGDLSPLERLNVETLPGGIPFLEYWNAFLERYGVRGPSEIDLSRPRWREDPASLLNMLAGNLSHPQRGLHRAQVARLAEEARAAEERVIRGAGRWRGAWLRHLLRAVRAYLPMREHAKFLIVNILDLVKPVLLEAGTTLNARGQLESAADVWFLSLPEVRVALTTDLDFKPVILERRRHFQHEGRLTPPRVVTSDGEQITAAHSSDRAPIGALVGQGVSTGVVEGIVRVVRDPQTETLQAGEILVAPFTDPGWTPLFVTAAGLVTEVGGLMTHGSLVAREYGLPAVVGVPNATRMLQTGQRVRVNGDLGYVEVLEEIPGSATAFQPASEPETGLA